MNAYPTLLSAKTSEGSKKKFKKNIEFKVRSRPLKKKLRMRSEKEVKSKMYKEEK